MTTHKFSTRVPGDRADAWAVIHEHALREMHARVEQHFAERQLRLLDALPPLEPEPDSVPAWTWLALIVSFLVFWAGATWALIATLAWIL